MVTVYSTTDPKLVALIQLALRDAGVNFHVENANAGNLMPTPALRTDFDVREADAATAKRVIDDALKSMGEKPR